MAVMSVDGSDCSPGHCVHDVSCSWDDGAEQVLVLCLNVAGLLSSRLTQLTADSALTTCYHSQATLLQLQSYLPTQNVIR